MEDEALSGIQQKGLVTIRHVPVVPSLFMFMQHIFLCKYIINANQELNVVMFHGSYHFVQELKANSFTSESGAKGIGI